jgi:AAA+ superfamily predicted ATPase
MKKGGFKIIVENYTAFFEQFSRPSVIGSGGKVKKDILGQCALPEPAMDIQITGYSTGNHYNLTAAIRPSKKAFDIYEHMDLKIPDLSEFYEISRTGNAVYLLDGQGREEFVLCHRQPNKKWLQILAGEDDEEYPLRIPLRTISSKNNFLKHLNDFVGLVQMTVNTIYAEAGKDSGEIFLNLKPSFWPSPMRCHETPQEPADANRELLQRSIEIVRPGISFEEVGGQVEAKREIQGISFALRHPEAYARWGTKPPKGILLYGPPGTGKTLMAKALATEALARLYHIKVTDILSVWHGQTEKYLKKAFEIAIENRPSIVFLDEIDALAPSRDFSGEITQRTVATLLELLDGMEERRDLMVVASTNRVDAVDSALKRPGRIDRLIEVPLPDTEGRGQIFKIHMVKARQTASVEIFGDIDWDCLIRATDKWSGADIAEILRRTLEGKVREEIMGRSPGLVSTQDILSNVSSYERLRQTKAIGFQS